MPVRISRSSKPHLVRAVGSTAKLRPTQGTGPQGPEGPEGPQGAPGGSDASFAGWVSDPASQTRGTLDGAFAQRRRVNAALLGAIADGASHPLSERYATLAAAQAVYPHATALTDEIDWAALQAALNEAATTNPSREVELDAGTFIINRQLTFDQGVSIFGQGPCMGGTGGDLHWTRIKAKAGFSDAEMLKYVNSNPAEDTWHWGVIERLTLIGTGTTGPNGVNPRVMGETAAIRDVQVTDLKDGLYLSGDQVTAHIENFSAFRSRYGVNCDGVNSTVRLLGLSGDDNTSLLRVKGGLSAHVTVFGLKAENYVAGAGDPVIDVVDLDGGALTVIGGWCDANAARNTIVKVSKVSAANNPKITLMNVDGNSAYYTNLINDTISSKTLPRNPNGLTNPIVFWGQSTVVGGSSASLLLENGLPLRGRQTDGVYQALMLMTSANAIEFRAGSGGGAVRGAGGAGSVMSWDSAGSQVGFLGAVKRGKVTLPAAATDAATTQALANALRQALIDFGLAQ